MSKLYIVAVMVALLALVAVPAMAEPVAEDSDSAAVTLTIEEYCEIGYDGTSFDITLSGGAAGGNDSEGYSAGANFAGQISGSLTKPTDAPGTWSFDIDAAGETPVTFGPGTTAGTVTVTVSEVGLADGNGVWDTGGTMVITVSAAT